MTSNQKSMRILLITNMYPSKAKPYAGIFVRNQFEELCRISREGEQVMIYFMRRQFTSRAGSVLKYLKAFVRFIPHMFQKYDVVHLHFFYPLIYLVWVYKMIHPGAKVVVTFHGEDITRHVTDSNQGRLRKISRIVDFTIPVGTTLANMVEKKLGLPRGKVLPVGVNNRVFYNEPGIAKTYDFIWIGSFIYRKGLDVLIQSIRELLNNDCSFCFCGSGELLPDLQELQRTHAITIRQNQTQEELRGLLNASRYFVLMSRNEGFPTATIEAMYCGLPVLTSDIPQFREQVTNGVNGYTSPMDDITALKNALLKLKNLPEKEYQLLQEGALKSFKELSLQQVCQTIMETYRKLAAD